MSARAGRVADGGFQPLRVALVVAVVIALALGIDAAFARAGFVDSLALVFALALAVPATGRAIGLWRGSVPHTAITYAPALMSMSRERVQAATPCAVVAFDGAILSFAVLVTSGGEGPVTRPLMLAGGAVFLLFTLAWICVGAFLRPRLLLPATMRPS